MTRSLNKVQLIGHVTKDPESSTLEDGTSICNFTIATNRSWTTSKGEKKDSVEYHRIVAWQKLAEVCMGLIKKGSRVYVEGRISSYTYLDKDGVERREVEIIVNDVIVCG